jgi:hypothetical protein
LILRRSRLGRSTVAKVPLRMVLLSLRLACTVFFQILDRAAEDFATSFPRRKALSTNKKAGEEVAKGKGGNPMFRVDACPDEIC